MNEQIIADNAELWGLEFSARRPELLVSGSPERCADRACFQTCDGALYVLERLNQGQETRRNEIGRLLSHLFDKGIPVQVYLPVNGSHVAQNAGQHWQISPYCDGDELPRPAFIHDTGRGRNLALFLSSMYEASESAPVPESDVPPALDAYVADMGKVIKFRHPGLHARLERCLEATYPLLEKSSGMVQILSHGDFHPLNVVWSGVVPSTVIDWEFTAMRPKLYDTANLIGCVGIEDPQALVRGLNRGLIRELSGSGFLVESDIADLPSMVLALRFAWLSEWLRRRDQEMIELELDYMDLLTDNLDDLGREWIKTASPTT